MGDSAKRQAWRSAACVGRTLLFCLHARSRQDARACRRLLDAAQLTRVLPNGTVFKAVAETRVRTGMYEGRVDTAILAAEKQYRAEKEGTAAGSSRPGKHDQR